MITVNIKRNCNHAVTKSWRGNLKYFIFNFYHLIAERDSFYENK